MREIKFRCWIDYGPGHCTMLYDRGNLSEFFDAADGSPTMQYTGLKDKNGKKIYEGDIVRNHWYSVSGNFLGRNWVVKYGGHSVHGQDYYSNYADGFYFDSESGVDDETYNIQCLPCDEGGKFEIIGNIYENPELLEEK